MRGRQKCGETGWVRGAAEVWGDWLGEGGSRSVG